MAELDWKSRMSTANFRNMDFLTESHDAKGGRRLVIFEYPGAEESNVEDMGARAWDGRLNAYFIGADYDIRRDQFLKILNTPGADWLTHPWLGDKWVRVKDWSLSENIEKGGMCTFAIEFVAGGQAPQAATVDRVDSAFAAIDNFGAAVVDDFVADVVDDSGDLPLNASSLSSFIANIQSNLSVLDNLISMARLPLTWANQVKHLVDSIKGDIAELLSLPQAYANVWLSLANMFGGASSDDSSLLDTSRPMVVNQLTRAATVTLARGSDPSLNIDQKLKACVIADTQLTARLLVMSASQIALADYRTANDRDMVLERVTAAIDALLPQASDSVFEAALSMRATLIDALLAQDLDIESTRDILSPLPATVLAHRLEMDESVFLVRNGVRHPLFVQGRIYG